MMITIPIKSVQKLCSSYTMYNDNDTLVSVKTMKRNARMDIVCISSG